MIIIKDFQTNKTIIFDNLNENDNIYVYDLKRELENKCNITKPGRLILCGKILDDNMKITEIKKIYQNWNGKIIYI